MSVGMFDGSDDLLRLRHLSHPLLPCPCPCPCLTPGHKLRSRLLIKPEQCDVKQQIWSLEAEPCVAAPSQGLWRGKCQWISRHDMIESDLGEQMANKVFHAWKNISFELIFSSDIKLRHLLLRLKSSDNDCIGIKQIPADVSSRCR